MPSRARWRGGAQPEPERRRGREARENPDRHPWNLYSVCGIIIHMKSYIKYFSSVNLLFTIVLSLLVQGLIFNYFGLIIGAENSTGFGYKFVITIGILMITSLMTYVGNILFKKYILKDRVVNKNIIAWSAVSVGVIIFWLKIPSFLAMFSVYSALHSGMGGIDYNATQLQLTYVIFSATVQLLLIPYISYLIGKKYCTLN